MTNTKAERRRLQRAEANIIAARLKKLGLVLEVRPYRISASKNEQFVASFFWVANKGWRMTSAHPYIRARADLDVALDEIAATVTSCEAADKAWEDYTMSPSEKNWQIYQGVLAAHYLKLYKQAPPMEETK